MRLSLTRGSRNRYHERRGIVYLVVLMASLIVASMALSAINISHWHARDLNGSADLVLVRQGAYSAIEHATAQINNLDDWRSSYVNNVDISPIDYGSVSFVYRFVDDDGDLADDDFDDVTLIATARLNEIQFTWEVELTTSGDALSCLDYSIASNGDLEVKSGYILASDQAVASNQDIEVESDSYLTADCYYDQGISGDIYGNTVALSSAIEFPSTSHLMEHYREIATEIQLSDLPSSGGYYLIQDQHLSDSSNGLNGSLNSEGVYYINCNYNLLRITNSRLQCTLVIDNPGNGSIIDGSMHWEAAVANYPILLVDGDMDFALSRSPLVESSTSASTNSSLSADYYTANPSSNTGATPTTSSIAYPSQLRGLVHVSGNARMNGGDNEFMGCILSGNKLEVGGTMIMHHRAIYSENPPPGFRASQQMRVVPGTLRRINTPDDS
ncbi:MAG: hypothetical protein AAF483_22155 [Planctomycetota bacterium]